MTLRFRQFPMFQRNQMFPNLMYLNYLKTLMNLMFQSFQMNPKNH